MNIIDKLKNLKKIGPDKEWSCLAMAEIMKSEIAPEPTLLQRLETFVNLHNNAFKTFAVSVTTAALIIGVAAFMQIGQVEQNNFLIDSNVQAEINSILDEIDKINLAVEVEVDENRITERNKTLMTLLDQRHTSRQNLQSIISKEISDIKIKHQGELTDQNMKLLLLAKRSNQINQAEYFLFAFFILENIEN